MPQDPVGIRFTSEGGATTVVVAVSGELDAETAPHLRDALVERIDCGAKAVVVDLGDVAFVDSSALGVLVMVARRLGPGTVVLASAQGQIVSLFEATHLDRVFDIFPTTAEAIAHLAVRAADATMPEAGTAQPPA
jgi:anti-sigma B factor antagonist